MHSYHLLANIISLRQQQIEKKQNQSSQSLDIVQATAQYNQLAENLKSTFVWSQISLHGLNKYFEGGSGKTEMHSCGLFEIMLFVTFIFSEPLISSHDGF